MDDDLLMTREAAAVLGVSASALKQDRVTPKMKVPYHQYGDLRAIRYSRQDIKDYLRATRVLNEHPGVLSCSLAATGLLVHLHRLGHLHPIRETLRCHSGDESGEWIETISNMLGGTLPGESKSTIHQLMQELKASGALAATFGTPQSAAAGQPLDKHVST